MSLLLNSALITQSYSTKATVRAASTASGTLATSFENGDTFGGVTLVTGDRILIKDQSTGSQNGVYVVEATGAPTRDFDLPTGLSANGVTLWVQEGTNANTAWICTAPVGTDVVGTDSLTFTQYDVRGTLSVARGGLGTTTLTSGNVLIGAGTSAVTTTKAAPTGDFVGTTDAQQLDSKTLNQPIVLTAILDANSNELFRVTATGSAVNEFTVINAATGNAPTLSATGGDTNINLKLQAKGTGSIDASSTKIINLTDPTSAQDAATKAYVDANLAGLDPKESCRLATTADLGATYATTPSNGQFTSAPTTIDSVAIAAGNRILVKNQTDAKENGIYTVGVTTTTWTRAADLDGVPVGDVSAGAFTFIEQGTVNKNNTWALQGNGVLTLNTNNLIWVKFSSIEGVSARIAYPLLTTVGASATSTTYTTVGYFTWINSRASTYNSGRLVYTVTDTTNRTLFVRLFVTTGSVTVMETQTISAGSYADVGGTVAFTNPTVDSLIVLQIRKSAGGGTSPNIYGVTIEWLSDTS